MLHFPNHMHLNRFIIFIALSHLVEAVKHVYQDKRIAFHSDPVNDPKLIKENDTQSAISKSEKRDRVSVECRA